MGVESKEPLLHDLESGRQTTPASQRTCTPSLWLPPLAFLRRKKLLVVLLLLPAIYLMLVYNGNASTPFDYNTASEAGAHVLDSLQSSLHHAAPAVNELAGKLPTPPHHYDDAHLDKDGHLHNALLDSLHVEGTSELAALKQKLDHDPAASAATSKLDLALQVGEMTKFDAKDESMLLLLHALRDKKFTLQDDWNDIFFERTPLAGGLFASLNAGPTNKFTQLLAQVGLPKPSNTTGQPSSPKFSILNDAHQLYSLSRADWVARMREPLGLTVFSKSYCPYSKRTKALLTSLNATFTVYEVDLRPDAHNLQPLLAQLTRHKTFPTVMARDHLVGGNDDVQDLNKIHALNSILQSVGAL
ncbi:hypothetical protein PaG_01120 [Moesziomyces aphidis]|uniref:Glutaredoxin domain-containing protein n=1 Tax=Moesziomyces aphidis TaxID=84754 RepID=W3VU30_MOEAP|nr:hypothetical protein PaG_01120 [Moesziomyces aphidis]